MKRKLFVGCLALVSLLAPIASAHAETDKLGKNWLGAYVGSSVPGYEIGATRIVVAMGQYRTASQVEIINDLSDLKQRCAELKGMAIINVRMESHLGTYGKVSSKGELETSVGGRDFLLYGDCVLEVGQKSPR
jgi:hypothetical protein